MARRKKNREINVFSASAIDLFASSMGVFIILVVVLFPYFGNKSKKEPTKQLQAIKQELKKTKEIVKKSKVEIKEK